MDRNTALLRILKSHTESVSTLRTVANSRRLHEANAASVGDVGLFLNLEGLFSLLVHGGKNCLGPIKGYASLIQDDNECDSNSRRWADKIIYSVERIEGYFEWLNAYRLGGVVGLGECSWRRIIAGVMERSAGANARCVPVEITCEVDGPFLQHGELLKRVLGHVITNAFECVDEKGKVALSASHRTGGGFVLRISDTGCGIEAANAGLIWKPFYTTKSDHIGLGLSYVAAAAPVLGMDVEVNSTPGQGTTVTLILAGLGG